MVKNKKIIIVYSLFGTGHLRVANIIEDMLRHVAPNYTVKKVTTSELTTSSSIQKLESFWNFSLKHHFIRAADFLVNKMTRYLTLPLIEFESNKKMYSFMEKENPDIIISTVSSFNKGLGYYAEKNRKKFIVFIADLFPSYFDYLHPTALHFGYLEESKEIGQSHDSSLTYFTHQISSTISAKQKLNFLRGYYNDFFLKRKPVYITSLGKEKKNNFKIVPIGIFAERKHYQKSEKKLETGLDPSRPTVLVASGGQGGRFVYKIIKKICQEKLNIIAVCGHSQKYYRKVTTLKSLANVKAYTFTKDLNLLMEMSDVAIIRPSASIFLELILHQVPIILSSPVLSNDLGCVEILKKYGLGKLARSYSETKNIVMEILSNSNEYQANFNHLLSQYADSYEKLQTNICKFILEDNFI
ncbi:MAG: glycosyltransferase [Candidatus Paceibacterota bacterium]|jgi:UDP-N-acetylglucosamine:LPS N-acetylglucosamine transferase